MGMMEMLWIVVVHYKQSSWQQTVSSLVLKVVRFLQNLYAESEHTAAEGLVRRCVFAFQELGAHFMIYHRNHSKNGM